MSNPLDTNSIKHEIQILDFNDVWYQIAEPVGFDGAEFVLLQNSQRYSRDIVKFAVDKLKFVDAIGIDTGLTQQINPFGDTSNRLDYGLGWLLPVIKEKGFEAKVYYRISVDGLVFRTFQLDFTDDPLTDGKTYVECKLIDNEKVANFKRTFDSKFNAFADKNWNEETITPIETFDYLKRASVFNEEGEMNQLSYFNKTVAQWGGDAHVFQPCLNIVKAGIENALTSFLDIEYLPDTADVTLSKQLINDRTVIKAKKRIVNLKIKISGLMGSFLTTGFFTRNRLRIAYGNIPIDDWTTFDLFESTNTSFTFNNLTYEVTVPFLEVGQRVWIFFSSTNGNPTQASTPISSVSLNIADTMKIEMTANTQGFDQVIKAFRWIDLIKQASKFNQNINVNAGLLDVGGVHYNNAIFNKRMMTSRVDNFFITPKDVFESVYEVNNDFEVSENEIFINHQKEFYQNIQIGSFLEVPSIEYSEPLNKRAQVNRMNYGYKVFEQDRTTTGTSLSVHTDMELRIRNEQVENVIDRKILFSRDAMASQKAIELEVTNPTTNTEDDNNYYIENMVALPPSSFGLITAILAMRVINGRLEILNIDSDGDFTNIAFTWTNRGIGVGQTVSIIVGANLGNYTVFAIEPNKITLTPIGFTPSFSGDAFIQLRFFYSGVAFQTRTDQGFSLIENISNTFSNLFYTIKRNIQNYFSEHLAMVLFYSKKDIIVAKPPINADCTTQLTSESAPVIESAPILYSGLLNPLITPVTYNGNLIGEYSDVVAYLNAYKVNRGFLLAITPENDVRRVYPQEFKYNISTNEIEILRGEVQFETENLIITGTISNLFVNDAPYNLSGVADWWRFQNDYLQLFDEKSRPLSGKYKYNLVILNGVTYSTKEELVAQLVLLNE